MIEQCKCGECNKDIDAGNYSYCERCYVGLKEALEKAQERICELEGEVSALTDGTP